MSAMLSAAFNRLRSFLQSYRGFCEKFTALVELNLMTFRALQQLFKIPVRILQIQLRICAMAIKVVRVPVNVAHGSLELMGLVQASFVPPADRQLLNNEPTVVISAIRSIVNAIQLPLKFMILPVAILEAPFRFLSRQPTTQVAAVYS